MGEIWRRGSTKGELLSSSTPRPLHQGRRWPGWMVSNRLQLNTAKTKVTWCASDRRQHRLPTDPLSVGNDIVEPVRQSTQSAISVSIWMLTLPRELTSQKLSAAALQLSTRSAAFASQLICRYFDPSSLLRCCHGWTTGVPLWLGCQCLVSYLTGSSRCSMLLYG